MILESVTDKVLVNITTPAFFVLLNLKLAMMIIVPHHVL